MNAPLVLRTAKRRFWLLLEAAQYRAIAPSDLRARLKRIGLGWTLAGLKGERTPSEVVSRYGASVTRKAFDQAARGAL